MAIEQEKFLGVYRGNVYSNKDPLNQRRIRVRVPMLFGEEITEWAWPKDEASTHFGVPTVGQGVYVSFIGGDPSFPMWMGSFGKDPGPDYSVDIEKLKKTEPISDVTDLLRLTTTPNGVKQVDLMQTLLYIVRNRYYGSFYHTGTQAAVAANTAYAMPLNTTESANGVSITNGSRITMEHEGVYNLAFSAQFVASNNSEHTVYIWLRHQGVDVPNSGSKIHLKGEVVAAWNFFVKTTTLPQYWELMWSSSTGGSVVSLASVEAASPVPAIPAVILTVNKVR